MFLYSRFPLNNSLLVSAFILVLHQVVKRNASTPDDVNKRVIIVGDIHGMAEELKCV